MRIAFIVFFIGSLIWAPLSVSAVSRCEEGINKRITKLVEGDQGFLQKLSKALMAKEGKQVAVGETIKDLRKLRCALDSICDHAVFKTAFEIAGDPKKADQIKFPLEIPCTPFNDIKTVYNREDFIGKDAICMFPAKSDISEIELEYELCKKQTTINFQGISTLTATSFQKATRQDTGNYYSAKLLHLNDRVKTCGDNLQKLNRDMRKSFESMSCRCKK